MPRQPDYIAQTTILVNGVRGYNAGDPVPASAVANLGLTVGVEVLPAHAGVIPRPAGNARRADWEGYWLGQGLSREEVDAMTRDEMAARPTDLPDPEQPGGPVENPTERVAGVNLTAHPQPDNVATPAAPPDPPGRNARKNEWVEYAVARGMPRYAAEESTIEQLQAYDYSQLGG